MIRFSDAELVELIESDVPFGDLTTNLIGFSGNARLSIRTRGDIALSSLDSARRIAHIYHCHSESAFCDGEVAKSGDEILGVVGEFEALHCIYKSIQNLLEYACGIATKAYEMVQIAKSINPNCEILATRKSFPYSKKLCLKSALDGGASIHRLGLSDTILFFDNHIVAFESKDAFLAQIKGFRAKIPERKIIAECSDVDFARSLLDYGIDGVQCDKMDTTQVAEVVRLRNDISSTAIILAAGGINAKNCAEYAKIGVDGIVTSAIYRGGANLGAKITLMP